MKRKERRAYERRFRKKTERSFPSPSVIRRYLLQFHNKEEESARVKGVAFIPTQNQLLQNLVSINDALINFSQKQMSHEIATLDQDATLIQTHKQTALYSYKKHKAYQAFNTYWHEARLLLHSEFRDGNVNAGFEQLRILQTSLDLLPEGVKTVYLRSDSAGYQQELLEYCAKGENKRFGVIEFAIATSVTESFKKAVALLKESDWKPIIKTEGGLNLKTNQEWAEVCFVPGWTVRSKNSPMYRYIAIREPMKDVDKATKEKIASKELPFQTMDISNKFYKLFGLITNRTIGGNELIDWHRKRCGSSEKVHSVEKSELAGGLLPSNMFGANAAWWQIMILAFNLNVLIKTFAFPEALKNRSMKGLRFHVIGVAGRVVKHAGRLMIKLSGGQAVASMICGIRRQIIELMPPLPQFSTA